MGLQGFNFLIIFAVSTSYTPKMRCCELRKVNHEVTAFYDHAPNVVVIIRDATIGVGQVHGFL